MPTARREHPRFQHRSTEVRRNVFSSNVTRQLENVQTNVTVENHWEQCTRALTDAATEVLGPRQLRPKKEWFDAECTKVTAEKNAERLKWLGMRNTRGAGTAQKERYMEARRRAVQVCRAKRRRFEDDEMRKVEALSSRGDTRKFYQQVKRQREGYTPPSTLCYDSSGNLLVNHEDILARWREYFSELLGSTSNRAPNSHFGDGNPEDVPPPTTQEI